MTLLEDLAGSAHKADMCEEVSDPFMTPYTSCDLAELSGVPFADGRMQPHLRWTGGKVAGSSNLCLMPNNPCLCTFMDMLRYLEIFKGGWQPITASALPWGREVAAVIWRQFDFVEDMSSDESQEALLD